MGGLREHHVQPAKNWKPGKADEVWKVMVCARDAERADDLISGLVYILTDCGSDEEKGMAQIARMSGQEIIDTLKTYKKASYDSVKNGMNGACVL